LPQAAAALYHLLAHAETNAGRRAASLPTMIAITRPLRIAAAFDDRAAVEAARATPRSTGGSLCCIGRTGSRNFTS
jgi:hypothetical protein